MVVADVLASGAKQMEVMLGEGLAKEPEGNARQQSDRCSRARPDGPLNAFDVTVKARVLDRRARHRQALVYTDIAT